MKPYEAICAEAEKLGWPKVYRDDLLVHDRNATAKHDPALPFLWGVRESGTHFIAGGTVESSLSADNIMRAFGGEECHWFKWDGSQLLPFQIKTYDGKL